MQKKLIQFLFMFLVVVYLKDGEIKYFNDASGHSVRREGSFLGKRVMWLEVWRERERGGVEKVASFNWYFVEHVENKK